AAINVFGARIAGFGAGAEAAVTAAVTAPAGGLAGAVVAAATGAGATAGAAAAAGATADAVLTVTGSRDDAAYAAGTALYTVGQGATPAQAAAITAAIMVTVADAQAGQAVRIVVGAARHAVLPAQLPLTDAAQAGAVASAAYYLGVPVEVERAVRRALIVGGVGAANAAVHAAAARNTATLNPSNQLFTVSYASVNGPQIVPHAD
ncbi:hypothetical protein ABT336_06365, partial [Micromonospora sp. NPDC000207]|uniref:hypothetical protein n=1 Tax=Micromonospora sp. NPDC000207 TaxID=3154246 RepID=UPI0033315964